MSESGLGMAWTGRLGYYARLNKGLDANLESVEESDGEVQNAPEEALFAVDGDLYVPPLADYALGISLGSEPKMLDEALHTPNAKQWQTVYNYEIAQLKKLSNWELVRLLPGKTPIPHSLIFKEKLGADGNINSWCVWLIAGGHRQTYGVNYDKIFATVEKMPSIQVVLANATQQDWEMHQVNVKSAYLNVLLYEEVYMLPPAGTLKPGQENMVCKLKKVLYGLKQAGCEWQKTLTTMFTNELGFKQSAVDHSIFFWHRGEVHTIIVVVTVPYPRNLTKSNSEDLWSSPVSTLELRSNKSLCQESDIPLIH